MSTGFYLLDRPRRGPVKFYDTRRKPVRLITIHITAGLEDLDTQHDNSAEATAEYARTTDRPVSWHSGADADSVIRLLPATYTAFHAAGFNSEAVGVEISKRHIRWAGMDPDWVRKTLANAAAAVRPWVHDFRIPLLRLSRHEVDAGKRGFVEHSVLDPGRRSDPGADFPWKQFFDLLKGVVPQPPLPPPIQRSKDMQLIRDVETQEIGLVLGDRYERVPDLNYVPHLETVCGPTVELNHAVFVFVRNAAGAD